MLTIKEQAESYRLGLIIGYFKVADVIHWADSIILYQDYSDINVIEVSSSGNKGINEVITQLEKVKGKIDYSIPPKTLLGLLYKRMINHNYTTQQIAQKLYILSQHINTFNLSEDLIWELRIIDDIFTIYGEKEAKFKITNLLSDFEVYAEEWSGN